MKVQSVKQTYLLNGMISLTEGAKYRVKSGVFRGQVGVFRGLEYQRHWRREQLVGTTVAKTESETPLGPVEPEALVGLFVEGWGGLESGYLEVDVLNVEPAE